VATLDMQMDNPNIDFIIKINKGPKAGETVQLTVELEDLEWKNIEDFLIEREDIPCYTNDEFTVIERTVNFQNNSLDSTGF
jgi:hypothetical protein